MDWVDEADDEYAGFEALLPTVDEFGLPSNLSGAPPEEFFQMLGRIVALSAIVEDHVRVFYQYLVGRGQHAYTQYSVSKLNACARTQLGRLQNLDDRQLARQFLRRAGRLMRTRNDYVHNMWPAQAEGKLFGHRTPQRKNAQVVTRTSSLAEMKRDLDCLIAFLDTRYQHRVLGLVSGGAHLRPDDGAV